MNLTYENLSIIDGPELTSGAEIKYISKLNENDFIIHKSKNSDVRLLSMSISAKKYIQSYLPVSDEELPDLTVNWVKYNFNLDTKWFEIIY